MLFWFFRPIGTRIIFCSVRTPPLQVQGAGPRLLDSPARILVAGIELAVTSDMLSGPIGPGKVFSMTTDSRQIAEFACSTSLRDVPPEVCAKLKATLLHNLGMIRAGADLAGVAIARAVPLSGRGAASLLHDGRTVIKEHAVIANAAMLHARTQDDTHLPAITHLAATALPALLATAESVEASGTRLLEAMLVAYESGCGVAVDVGPAASARGLRPSSVLGGIGAAAGVARLLGLDEPGVQSAVGLAASFGGGTGQTWVGGTDEWQYQVGVAGLNGMLAAELAAKGVRAADDALEGVAGLYRALTDKREPHQEELLLGTRWRTLEVTYKPFPVCAINQMPVTVLLAMMSKLGFSADDVDTVELKLAPAEASYPGTEEHAPFAGPSASLMSAAFCLAVALRENTITRAMVEAYDDDAVNELSSRIHVVSDEGLRPGQCVIIARGQGQTWHSDQIAFPASFDWDFDEVHRRLVGLEEERGMSAEALDSLVVCVDKLEQMTARDLIRAVAQP